MPVRDLLFAASTQGAAPSDPNFENVTLLLNGDGTNGAQNNTFLDSSTNNFTITRNGNTTQGSFSPYGTLWGNYFDGAGDFLTIPNNASLYFDTGDFTIECWINTSATIAYQTIANVYGSPTGNNGWYFSLGATGANLYLSVFNGSSDAVLEAGSGLNDGAWHHVAAVRTGTTLSTYIDGARIATTTNSFNITATSTFRLSGWSGGSRDWNGYISNFRIIKGSGPYNAASSTLTVPTAPLTAITNTSLLTCQSNRFRDASSNNFAITVDGNSSVQRFSPFEPTAPYSTSVIGGSGYFDGTTANLITSSAIGTIGTGDFSFEAWVYPTAVAAYGCIIGNDGAGRAVFLELGGARGFWFGGPEMNGGSVRLNQWTHLAICRTSGTASMYLNGTRTNTTSWTTDLSTAIVIGINNYVTASTSGFGITGYIASPRVFIGTSAYNAASTTITIPTTPPAATGATYLPAMTNAGIPDLAMQNNLETVGNAQVSTSIKKYGTGSLAFDGTGDYLQASNIPAYSFGTGDFTVECWFYANSLSASNFSALMGANNSVSNNEWGAYVRTDGVYFYGSGGTLTGGSGSVSTSTWYHYAACRSGNTLRIFLNGVQQASATVTGSYISTSAGLRVGDDPAPDNPAFNGYLDDVRISKVARYVSSFTPPTAALPTF